jgi:hypothetical protein
MVGGMAWLRHRLRLRGGLGPGPRAWVTDYRLGHGNAHRAQGNQSMNVTRPRKPKHDRNAPKEAKA